MAQYQLNYSGSEINQLLAKISVLESKLNTLQTTVNNIDMSSIQSELNSVKQQVQSINDELNTKDTTISNIQAKLTELENSINSLSSSIDSKDARVLADSKAYTDEQILKVSAGGSIDLDGYAKKTDLPTKTSQLANDSGYLTEHQDISGKADKSYVNTELAKKSDKTHTHSYNDLSDKPAIPSIDGLATKKELTDGLAKKSDKTHTHDQYLTEHQDISGKANKSDIPTKTSQLTNDSGYLTSIPSEYITEEELNAKGLATKTFVTNKIAEASLSSGEVDLSGYATKDELNAKANKSDIPNLDGYALKTDIPTVPTKVSDLANDSNFISSIPEEYITETELNAKGYLTSVPSEYVTETELEDKGYLTEHQDLSNYALKTEIPIVPTKTSQLTNDSGYLTSVPSEYITETELNEKGYLTEHQDISNKADRSEIPTKTSQLTNDSGFITKVPSEYITEIELNSKGLATETFVTNKIAEASLSGGGTITPVNVIEPAEQDVPRLYFYGDALPTTKDNVNLEMDYKSNTMKFHSYVKLKCQGTSSMSYAKKNFTVALYEDSARSIKLKKNFKGWGKQNKFCLKANWVDSTHARNISGARIAYDMVASRPDSPFKQELLKCPRNGVVDGFPIKVYFNGEFWGIYTFNIPKDAWMFNMNEDNPNHIVLCAERNTDGNSSLINSCQFRKLWDGVGGGDWSYEVGTPSDTVKNSLNRCISFVMNASDEEFHDNISQYFDLYSLLDYYCFSYVACHLDGLAKNMLLATYDGVVWGACLYDMDSIYGVYWDGSSFVSPEYKCPEQYQEQFSRLWVRIEECFADELKARYAELRQEALSLTNIVGHVEEIYDLLSPNMKTDETTKWPSIPTYNTNTITRFRNYMRDRVKYTDAEVALIGVFIACESITLDKTELNMGIFGSEGTEGGVVDDSNKNYIADAEWQVGALNGDGSINIDSASDRYCKITNLPIGEYTLHHPSYTYKRICIKGYDASENQSILLGTETGGWENTNDMTFKINCSDTIVCISLYPKGSEDFSGVTLKRQDLPTPLVQDKILNMSVVAKPGWGDQGDISTYSLIEFKVASTTEITDPTNIRTISIGDEHYYVAWCKNGIDKGSYVEKYPGKCALNTQYEGNWYVLVSLPASKYGTTVNSFKTYCADKGITEVILNSSNISGGSSSVVTTDIETTWESGYIKRNKDAVINGTAGQIQDNDIDCTCDFIPVHPGDIIELKTNATANKIMGAVAYDSDKNYLSVFVPVENGTGTWDAEGISDDSYIKSLALTNLPEGTAYIRICIDVPVGAIANTITEFTLTRIDNTGGSKLLTYTLRATVTPANTMDKVVWSVSPTGICTVKNGVVTAVANGDCIITATCGQQSATCNVNVSGITITESGEINITGLDWSDTASFGYTASGQLKDGDCYISRTPLYVSSGTYTFANKNDGTFNWKEIFAYDNGGNFVKMNETSDNGRTGESVITITDDDNIAYLLFSAHPIAVTDTPVEKLAFIKQKVIPAI